MLKMLYSCAVIVDNDFEESIPISILLVEVIFECIFIKFFLCTLLYILYTEYDFEFNGRHELYCA